MYEARDHALECLSVTNIIPRKVWHWIGNCLKCTDCILLVYIREVLSETVETRPDGKIRERDVYLKCEALGSKLGVVGKKCGDVYNKRNQLEHVQIVNEGGQRQIRKVPNKKKIKAYEFTISAMAEVFHVMIPLYRAAFPEACTDAQAQQED